MIYICVPSHNEGGTIGLLLWKIRQVFQEFPREYQFLVGDDGSSDGTGEILEPYAKALPLQLFRSLERTGYAATLERLLREALELSDRPRRDLAILIHGDFSHSPELIPELVRKLESGADLVVAEHRLAPDASRAERWVRAAAPWLLRKAVRIPGVSDITSGFAGFRLSTLRQALRTQGGLTLQTDGWAANAELLSRTAAVARQVESIPGLERLDRRVRPRRLEPVRRAKELWRAGATLRKLKLEPAAR